MHAVHPGTAPAGRRATRDVQIGFPADLSNHWLQTKSTLTANPKDRHKAGLLGWR